VHENEKLEVSSKGQVMLKRSWLEPRGGKKGGGGREGSAWILVIGWKKKNKGRKGEDSRRKPPEIQWVFDRWIRRQKIWGKTTQKPVRQQKTGMKTNGAGRQNGGRPKKKKGERIKTVVDYGRKGREGGGST